MLFLFLLFWSTVDAMNHFQTHKTRELLRKGNANLFVSVVDSVQDKTLAFTTADRMTIHIDAVKFECCPNTFTNVMWHEIAHTHGRDHSSTRGDIMNYSMTKFPNGRVAEDSYTFV